MWLVDCVCVSVCMCASAYVCTYICICDSVTVSVQQIASLIGTKLVKIYQWCWSVISLFLLMNSGIDRMEQARALQQLISVTVLQVSLPISKTKQKANR